MHGFVEGAITIGLAGLAAGGLGFLALMAPSVFVRTFRQNIHPAADKVVMLAMWLASATVATAWPALSWLWWPQ